MNFNRLLTFLCILFIVGSCSLKKKEIKNQSLTAKVTDDAWQWGPFEKIDSINPVLQPSFSPVFYCPVRDEIIHWEEKDVFNPAALVKDGQIHLIYRAEDSVGSLAGTSRIGIALSSDGLHFEKLPQPVFYPDNDRYKTFEWEGGCEDPRIVETYGGYYFMTYTAWNGEVARLSIASTSDLRSWTKHGPIFSNFKEGKYLDLWSKSGSIICSIQGEKLIAEKINDKYWMYWGDTNIYMAWSEDLINWIPVEDKNGNLKVIFGPRDGYFDSDLVEPGPPALITGYGVVLLYNSRNNAENGDPELPPGTYAAGQILFDIRDPQKVIARSKHNFFKPDNDYEITGQVNNVCFLEGLVPYKGKWYLYYGTADSKIAVAVYDPLKWR